MRTVHKFKIPLATAEFHLGLNMEAKVLYVGMQRGEPHVWVEVDTKSYQEPRKFTIVGTGTPLPAEDVRHVGTWQQDSFVFHLYEHQS